MGNDYNPAPSLAYANTMTPPAPPVNALDTTPGADPTSASQAQTRQTNAPKPPSGETVKMTDPSGNIGDVPSERVADASKSGYHPVIQMVDPNNQAGYVRVDRAKDALASGYSYGFRNTDTSTIGPAPKPGAIASPDLGFSKNPITEVFGTAKDSTESDKAEHPIKTAIGAAADKVNDYIRETGGGVLNVLPMVGEENLIARSGEALSAAKAPIEEGYVRIQSSDGKFTDLPQKSLSEAQARDGGLKVVKVGKTVQPPATEVTPEHFTYKEPGPKPQHGTPVKTPQPLDNATITNLKGGANLSPEAMDALRTHVGGTPGKEIPVGSTPENILHKASAPLQKTLTDTSLQMNRAIQDAPPFASNTLADPKSTLLSDIDSVRDNLPLKLDDPLNKVVDTQVQAAYPALESTDPQEVLAYRRKLGNQIDWNNISNSPETAGEAKNLTQVKIYNALGNKLHAEIPLTADLDKVFQPNLELQSFLDKNGVDRNPALANDEHISELNKGQNQIATDAYNETIAKNRELAGLNRSDVEPTIGNETGTPTKVDEALNRAIGKFNLTKPGEQSALRELLKPSVEAGKLWGANTDYVGGLKRFDQLSPAERAARFANPNAVRDILRSEARKQILVKYGSKAAATIGLGALGTLGYEIVKLLGFGEK